MARYPNDYDVFQEKRDNVDDVMALDINEAYYAILAIEGTLGKNPQGSVDVTGYTVADRLSVSLDTRGRIRSDILEQDMYKNQSIMARHIHQGYDFAFRGIDIGGALGNRGAKGTVGFPGCTIDYMGNITTESNLNVEGTIVNSGNTFVYGNITNTGTSFLDHISMTSANSIEADLGKETFTNLLKNGELIFSTTTVTHTQTEINYWTRESASTVSLDSDSTKKVLNFPSAKINFLGASSNIYQYVNYYNTYQGYNIPVVFSCWINSPSTNVFIALEENTRPIVRQYVTSLNTWQYITVRTTTSGSGGTLKAIIGVTQGAGDNVTFNATGAMLTFGNLIKSFSGNLSAGLNYSDEGFQNIIENGHFEKWVSSVPTKWSIVSGTIAQEVSQRYSGNYSLRINNNSSIKQVLPLNFYKPNIADKTTYFYVSAWAYSTNASVANPVIMKIRTGNTTYIESNRLTESGSWKLLEIRFTLTNSGSIDRLELSLDTGNCTGYVSMVSAYQGFSPKAWTPHPADVAGYYDI